MRRSLQLASTLLIAGCAFAGKVSSDFKVTNPFGMVKVTVQFAAPPTSTVLGALNGKGASVLKKFKHFPRFQVFTVPQIAVPLIAQIP